LRVYNVGRATLAFVVLCLGAAPFHWLLDKYSFGVGVGAVPGLVFFGVSGAFEDKDVPGASPPGEGRAPGARDRSRRSVPTIPAS
jgi:hypothetical protein